MFQLSVGMSTRRSMSLSPDQLAVFFSISSCKRNDIRYSSFIRFPKYSIIRYAFQNVKNETFPLDFCLFCWLERFSPVAAQSGDLFWSVLMMISWFIHCHILHEQIFSISPKCLHRVVHFERIFLMDIVNGPTFVIFMVSDILGKFAFRSSKTILCTFLHFQEQLSNSGDQRV